MTPRNGKAPECANTRGLEASKQPNDSDSATLMAAMHMSATPLRRPFATDAVGLASSAALMLGGSRDLRRSIERDTRRRAAAGDRTAAELLASVEDLRRRAAGGDLRAARVIASVVSGK